MTPLPLHNFLKCISAVLFLSLVLESADAVAPSTRDNISTTVGETLIGFIPLEQDTLQVQSLTRLMSKGGAASAVQEESVFQSLGSFFQTLLDKFLNRDENSQ